LLTGQSEQRSTVHIEPLAQVVNRHSMVKAEEQPGVQLLARRVVRFGCQLPQGSDF
jgi:hypothetical protein